jgi:hypothetical protein
LNSESHLSASPLLRGNVHPFQPFFPPEEGTRAIASAKVLCALAEDLFEDDDPVTSLDPVVTLVEKLFHPLQNALRRVDVRLHLFHEAASFELVPSIESSLNRFFRLNPYKISAVKMNRAFGHHLIILAPAGQEVNDIIPSPFKNSSQSVVGLPKETERADGIRHLGKRKELALEGVIHFVRDLLNWPNGSSLPKPLLKSFQESRSRGTPSYRL